MLDAARFEPVDRPRDPAPMALIRLGGGRDAAVELDPVTMTVCKRYRQRDIERSPGFVEREHERLRRFSRLLAPYPYLACPEPVEADAERGILRMTYCPGQRVDAMFRNPPDEIEDQLAHIAEQVTTAVKLYVREFDEPFDLATYNVLYDQQSRRVYVIDLSDFELPMSLRHRVTDVGAAGLTFGNFIGYTVTESVRRRSVFNRAYWRCHRRLLLEVLVRSYSFHDVSPAMLGHVSTHFYRYATRVRRLHGYLWHESVGGVLYRMRTSDIIDQLQRSIAAERVDGDRNRVADS
jgi:hypothetical protein